MKMIFNRFVFSILVMAASCFPAGAQTESAVVFKLTPEGQNPRIESSLGTVSALAIESPFEAGEASGAPALRLPSSQAEWKIPRLQPSLRGAIDIRFEVQEARDAEPGARQLVFTAGASSPTLQYFIQAYVTKKNFFWRILVTEDGAELGPVLAVPIPEGQPVHLVCGWDAEAGRAVAFVNGAMKASVEFTSTQREALEHALVARSPEYFRLGANERRRSEAPKPVVLLTSLSLLSALPADLREQADNGRGGGAFKPGDGLLAQARERYTKAGRDWRFMALIPEPEGDLLGFDHPGELPEFPEKGDLLVQKVLFTDCRVAKAFVTQPIDGRPDSLSYSSLVSEYDHAGYGAAHWELPTYEYIERPGIHVALADGKGFNAAIIRGGFRGEVYRDVDADDGPGNGVRIAEVDSSAGPAGPTTHYQIARLLFKEPVTTANVSFFRKKGLLGDVAFYRVGDRVTRNYPIEAAETFYAGETLEAEPGLGFAFRPMKVVDPDRNQYLTNFDRRFFRLQDRRLVALESKPPKAPFTIPAGEQIHFLSPPMPGGKPLDAVRLEFHLAKAAPGAIVMMALQDPLLGSRELLRYDARLNEGTTASCILDFGDQLMPPGGRVWITIACNRELTLLPESRFELLPANSDTAKKEYVDQLLLLAKGEFSKVASARPWVGREMDARWWENYDGSDWSLQRRRLPVHEMYALLERIRAVDPAHPVAVGQYWNYLRGQAKPGRSPENLPALEPPDGVPRWAFLLQRTLKRSVAVADWWIANRKSSRGEFGSYLNDDTDLMQWWPALVFSDSDFARKVRPVYRQVAELVLAHNLKEGVNIRKMDPLHAYEEGLNHMCAMPVLMYGDPRYVEWLMEASRSTRRWLDERPDGTLEFRVSEFGYATMKQPENWPRPPKPSITSGLMLQPQLILAWYNRNPEALDTLKRYAAGSGYYIEGGLRNGLSITYGLYAMTGDVKYLALDNPDRLSRWGRGHPPFYANAPQARQSPQWLDIRKAVANDFTRADEAWAANQSFALLEKSCEFALWGEPSGLWGGVEKYFDMWTAAEPVADRVFLPTPLIGQVMLGGYSARNRLWPAYAVSYEGLGGDMATAVIEQGARRLKVLIYNLGEKPISGLVRTWQLENGNYRVRRGVVDRQAPEKATPDAEENLELFRMAGIPVDIPPREPYILEVSQTGRYDELCARADLALSPDDIAQSGGEWKITIHNIGAKKTGEVQVALVDEKNQVLEKRTVPPIEAPLDLHPRVQVVAFPASLKAAAVVIDPDQQLPEITRLNNRISMPVPKPEAQEAARR